MLRAVWEHLYFGNWVNVWCFAAMEIYVSGS